MISNSCSQEHRFNLVEQLQRLPCAHKSPHVVPRHEAVPQPHQPLSATAFKDVNNLAITTRTVILQLTLISHNGLDGGHRLVLH